MAVFSALKNKAKKSAVKKVAAKKAPAKKTAVKKAAVKKAVANSKADFIFLFIYSLIFTLGNKLSKEFSKDPGQVF